MMGLPAGMRIWIAAGVGDMRAGFNGVAAMVQAALEEDPFSGQVLVFRGRRGNVIKVLLSTAHASRADIVPDDIEALKPLLRQRDGELRQWQWQDTVSTPEQALSV
jgi:transposase